MLLLKFTLLLLVLQNLCLIVYIYSEFNSLRTVINIFQHKLGILDLRICSYNIDNYKKIKEK